MGDLPEDARLADPRLSDHGDHLAAAEARSDEGVADLLHLGAAADKAREPASRGDLEAGAGSSGPHQLEYLNRFNKALHRHWPERGGLNEALHQSQRLTGHLDSAWRRQLLHARRHVCGSAHRRVFHAQIASHRANHHLAGVDPDSDLYECTFAPPHFIGVALHGPLHAQRGVTRAYGVILVSERGAE